MSLPKIKHPTFDITIDLTSRKVKIRPMLVKEEKILLMAKQSDDRQEQLNAIRQVVTNCVVSEIDCNQLSLFEIEYIFIKIRSLSISSKAKVAYRDSEDDKVYSFEVDLDKVQLIQKSDKPASNVVNLDGSVVIVLKYPPISLYTQGNFFDLNDEQVFDAVVAGSIDKIYDSQQTYDLSTTSEQELKEFIDQIPAEQYQQIQQFFNDIPTLDYKIDYTNSKGTKRTITLSTLDDFFTF